MVKADIHADNLRDYYAQLCAAQEAAHGADYCSHHSAIREAVGAGCRSYAEMGVNQGATLACAILAGFESVDGVDISLAPFRPAEPLFRAEARSRGCVFSVWEQDSRQPIGGTDFLLLDAVHTAAHLREELAVHGPHVTRRILIHDTSAFPSLHVTATEWGLRHGWTVAHREGGRHGWTLLSRWE